MRWPQRWAVTLIYVCIAVTLILAEFLLDVVVW